jgi:hypothetical protein
MKRIYIGYDDRESHFYELCKFSILLHASEDVEIIPLKHKTLRDKGLFTRGWSIHGQTGQMVDEVDGRPFSTQFSHSRFLVPALEKDNWKNPVDRYAMFVDCDFIFSDDPIKAFEEAENEGKPVAVVKHDFTPQGDKKMDNVEQSRYEKKLWTSLMFFDVNSPWVHELTADVVNTEDGRWLHQFKWLESDDQIGSISEKWNFIPDHSEPRVPMEEVGAIHYTEGGPVLEGYEDCKHSELYYWVEKHYVKEWYLATHAAEIEQMRQQLMSDAVEEQSQIIGA